MSATLSAYELQRLENIRKNNEVLNDLGLNGGAYLHRSRDDGVLRTHGALRVSAA
jgi:hypothetical protein